MDDQPIKQNSSSATGYIIGLILVIGIVACAFWYFSAKQSPAVNVEQPSAVVEQPAQTSPLSSGNTTADISSDLNQTPDVSAELDQAAAASAQAVQLF